MEGENFGNEVIIDNNNNNNDKPLELNCRQREREREKREYSMIAEKSSVLSEFWALGS